MNHWTPERIAQAKQRNFGESVTLTAAQFDELLGMVERLRKALEWYADKQNYTLTSPTACANDEGKKARAALGRGAEDEWKPYNPENK